MSQFDNLRNQAEKFAEEHPEQVEKYSDEAIQRGGRAVDQATGDRFDDEVTKGEQFADEHIGE